MSEIVSKTLAPGIRLHVSKIKKFKTVTVKVFLVRKLDEQATDTSLLPKVLQRGTANYPDALIFEKELENNFGSRLSARTRKIGEHHLIEFALHMPNPKYLLNGDQTEVFTKGINLLSELILNPYLEDNKFKNEYVDQEKNVLKQEIESLFNDKEEWAMQRCVEISCENEPYAIPEYGRIADLAMITSQSLTEFYYDMIRTAPIEIFVVGDIDGQIIEEHLHTGFVIKNKKEKSIDRINTIDLFPERIKQVIEHDEVNQGKLVISLRSKIGPCSELLPALLLYNNILGGGTHSKLFQSVREKNSLAYYVHTNMDRNKKMLFIEAGIDRNNFSTTIELIHKEMIDLQNGSISDEELTKSRTVLINSLWSLQDYSGGNIDYFLIGLLTGCIYSSQDMEKHLQQVKKEQIVEVAQQVALDTTYFLCSSEEAK